MDSIFEKWQSKTEAEFIADMLDHVERNNQVIPVGECASVITANILSRIDKKLDNIDSYLHYLAAINGYEKS